MGAAVEVEATLAIVGSAARSTAERVATLDRLAGCAVRALPTLRLRDVYLDRGDGTLRRVGLALRIRFVAGAAPVLGIKDAGRFLDGGGVERLERESPWGPDAVALLEEELSRAGLAVPSPAPEASDPPLEALRAAGFHAIQDRETLRRRGELVRGETQVAELVVDEVRYRIDDRTIVHREVEVEAGQGADAPATLVGRAARELAERFGSSLRPWDRPKLATGRALERLIGSGAGDLVAADGELPSGAYDRLAAIIDDDRSEGP